MENKRLLAFTAVGLAAAIAVPTIAFGNARTDSGRAPVSRTFVAELSGNPAATPPSDPDGTGTASFTFEVSAPGSTALGSANVCWDITYNGIDGTPVAAHIHAGGVGVNGPIVVPAPGVSFTNLGPNSTSGCMDTNAAVVEQIMAASSNFYINVHTAAFPGGAIRGQLSEGPAAAGEVHLLAEPLRAYDSRTTDGALALNTTRTVSLAKGVNGAGINQTAVPVGATGAIVTLTVTNTGTGVGGAGGFLKLYSAALTAPPAISTVNWFGGNQNIATTTQVAVNANGQVKVTDGANATDFVIDVVGWTTF
jgi:hypothetical protein